MTNRIACLCVCVCVCVRARTHTHTNIFSIYFHTCRSVLESPVQGVTCGEV